jgi:hypothetical protein
MQEHPQTTVSNPYYDLISTLYHELTASQTYSAYIRDAQSAGDQELTHFFQQAQQWSNQCAEQARMLLTNRVSASAGAMGQAGRQGEAGGFSRQSEMGH